MSDNLTPQEPQPILLDADVDAHVAGEASEYGRQLDAWLMKQEHYQPPLKDGKN